MDICTDLNTISHFNQSVVTIGAFDGMHCGHIEIIKDLKLKAEYKGIPAIVVTLPGLNKRSGVNTVLSNIEKRSSSGDSRALAIAGTCVLWIIFEFPAM